MEILFDEISQTLASYILPLFRISSMLMVMVVFGANTTPTRIRLMLSVAITVAVAPVIPPIEPIELIAFSTAFIILQQVLIGAAMGFVTQLVMQTFVLTGQIIGMQTSLGFSSMVDPTSGQQTPIVGNMFLLLATLIFLAVDGHLMMFRMLVASFETIPISIEGIRVENYRAMAMWASYMFGAALTMSISAIVALLLINFSFGVMTRASPQLNIFAIGFPVTMVSGLFILWLTLGPIMAHFGEVWHEAQILMCDILLLQCQTSGTMTF
ncbi:flagellar biosynthetic protein FliR [Shewanella maritima]|uniref:flagellar biosynthetic protein FliR n=1 Tax=Shewanella maritima TaxID=2520507 RepID=UPI003735787D